MAVYLPIKLARRCGVVVFRQVPPFLSEMYASTSGENISMRYSDYQALDLILR